jgi:small subunit ribosomal protein S16
MSRSFIEEKTMVRLRMQRVGRPKAPHFRIVAVDSRKARDAASLEIIGHYHPTDKTNKVTVDAERLKYWLSQGAQASDTLRTALKTAGAWVASSN